MRAIAKRTTSDNQILSAMRRGFTLVELLVVLALTAILFTIIFKPLVDSYNLTARARTQIESQATTRNILAEVTRILSNAEFVYDPTQQGTPPTGQDASLNIWLRDGAGNPYPQKTDFVMQEYIPAGRELDHTPYIGVTPLPIDPTSQGPISSDLLPPGQSGIALPLAPGRFLGRIWVGLNNNTSINDSSGFGQNGMPFVPYANRFEDTFVGINQDNRYTLLKAEVVTYIQDPTAATIDITTPYVPNMCLFHTTNGLKTGNLIVHDPNFYYDNTLAGGNEATAGTTKWAVPGWTDYNKDGQVEIWENWRAVATTLMPTGKIDLLALERDPNSNGILFYNNAGNLVGPVAGARPKVSPLVSFKPAFVQNDPGVPNTLDNAGNETPDPSSPSYSTLYGHWAQRYRVFIYRADPNNPGQDPTTRAPLDLYEGVFDPATQKVKIVHIDPSMGIMPGSTPPDPFSLPDIGPAIDLSSTNQLFSNPNITNSPNTQFAFNISQKSGLVSFLFGSGQVVHDAAGNPRPQRYSPDDINTSGASVDPPHRFVYLPAAMPTTNWGAFAPLNTVGIKSPLDPTQTWNAAAANAVVNGTTTTRIVPGSEIVYGPDQRPGVHYGQRIQYTRVSGNVGIVGPNEYRINYQDNPNIPPGSTDIRLRMGYIEFDSQPDGAAYNFATIANPASWMAQGPHSLPIYKFNTATMSIDTTQVADPVEISFAFQMNRQGDVVKVDYMTRQLIVFSLETRLYDLASFRPQITRVTEKIKVRNLQR